MKPEKTHPLEGIPTAVGSFFLDSGAHSIYTREVIDKKNEHVHGTDKYRFYRTRAFKAYCDEYAAFIKEHGWAMDFYANVDAIFSPTDTWRIQQYLENEHGLKPVPVIHWGTDIKWIHHYLDRGYTYLGIGGLGQEVTKDQYYQWADRVFSVLCPESNGYRPIVKTHGFAMTSWELMRRYPWWSVDSASWIKAAAYGMIYVPHMRKGKFVFGPEVDKYGRDLDDFNRYKPYSINVSLMSPASKERNKHFDTSSAAEKEIITAWLKHLKIPLGQGRVGLNEKGEECLVEETERGVRTHHKPRAEANLRYFMAMCDALPKWPWPFRLKINRGVGFGF